MFRSAAVDAGTYAVVAPSMQTTRARPVPERLGPATLRTELFRAGVYEVSPLGQPRTQQVGDFALMTLNRVLIPPPRVADGPHCRCTARPTFHPPRRPARRRRFALAAGDERTDLAITLRPVPAARVSGRLVTPDGSAPPPTAIRLVGEAMADVITRVWPSGPAEVGFETVTGMSDASGGSRCSACRPASTS